MSMSPELANLFKGAVTAPSRNLVVPGGLGECDKEAPDRLDGRLDVRYDDHALRRELSDVGVGPHCDEHPAALAFDADTQTPVREWSFRMVSSLAGDCHRTVDGAMRYSRRGPGGATR
jgi:hypothetical protein